MILRRARLRLTALTTGVILASIALFAFAVDRYVALAIDLELPADSEQSVNATLGTLRVGIAIGFALLAVITPFVSFLLARQSLRPVRESMAEQQRFVDDAAHELRTPIAAVQGELELSLLQDRSGEEYRQAVGSALTALAELRTLADALLLLARSGNPAADGGRQRLDPAELAMRAVDALPPQDRARIRVQASASGAVVGNAELLVRAIANLLENAVHYAGSDAEIRLSVDREGTTMRFAVADRGPGMTAQDAERAFDRFWRGPGARQSPGSGIGLSIVQRIAEGHRGRVHLHTEPGAGTTVTIALPAER
ncbi:MAG: HAMP domain-containing histidine kinase [Actinobacteria bacterium]|nr:HAMP domain-containing histidine kinase [Actinomycetota bacterium]